MEIYGLKKSSSSKSFLTLILTLLLFISPVCSIYNSGQVQIYTNFVKKSCNNITTYSQLCIKTLVPYAPIVKTSLLRMSNVALMVAIQATRNCTVFVSKLGDDQSGMTRYEVRSIRDCIGDFKDAISELKETVNAMGRLRGGDRDFQWSNAKTWGSAAITDVDSCLDGISNRKVNIVLKNEIRECVSGVEKLISNALSLINHLFY